MELTIGSLSIFIGPSGSSRLSDPTKQDSSASEPETVAMMEYSEGSSSEVNSPVSSGEVQKGKIAEDDETMENFDVGVQLKNLMICLDDTSDKSTDTLKIGLELFEDGDSIFSSFNSNIGKQCQVIAIVGDNSHHLSILLCGKGRRGKFSPRSRRRRGISHRWSQGRWRNRSRGCR
jgi:hypothetical protein